ncbi:hypothetical protein, partial [Priestia megaterium]|uniref:hypothetical protein n=1 Tax=Priestia megaterium TaxID=1404 RepID=UPI002FFDAC10
MISTSQMLIQTLESLNKQITAIPQPSCTLSETQIKKVHNALYQAIASLHLNNSLLSILTKHTKAEIGGFIGRLTYSRMPMDWHTEWDSWSYEVDQIIEDLKGDFIFQKTSWKQEETYNINGNNLYKVLNRNSGTDLIFYTVDKLIIEHDGRKKSRIKVTLKDRSNKTIADWEEKQGTDKVEINRSHS